MFSTRPSRSPGFVIPLVSSTVLTILAIVSAGIDREVRGQNLSCNSQLYGCSTPIPPPCANNTQCTPYSALNSNNGTTFPCPDGSGNTGSYYTSSGAATAWNHCSAIDTSKMSPEEKQATSSCAEGPLQCMTITLFWRDILGDCNPCGTAGQYYCGSNNQPACYICTPPGGTGGGD